MPHSLLCLSEREGREHLLWDVQFYSLAEFIIELVLCTTDWSQRKEPRQSETS